MASISCSIQISSAMRVGAHHVAVVSNTGICIWASHKICTKCRIFMELQEEYSFYMCKKSPNSCIGGNFLPALANLVTLWRGTTLVHKSLNHVPKIQLHY